MTRYVMIIDLTLCAGCETCAVACKQENNLPDGVWWTQLITVEANGNGFGPVNEMRLDYLPLSCQHCMDAPCVEVCPTSAAFRRKDGIIMQDPSLCIGCRYCMAVCPYTGVRVFSGAKPAYISPFPTGSNPIVHRSHTVEKCTFCAHRLDRGKLPVCVETCPMKARIFGDLDDPNSEVSQRLRDTPHFQLLVEKGTMPSVFYLV